VIVIVVMVVLLLEEEDDDDDDDDDVNSYCQYTSRDQLCESISRVCHVKAT
jgi:hypothetical protein